LFDLAAPAGDPADDSVEPRRPLSSRDQAARDQAARDQAARDHAVLAAQTEFIANISHELRTPLTSILGFAEVLASGMDGPLTPSQARDVETIQGSSRHLLELIDDLIDIASIEANRLQLETQRVDVGPVVREAAETVRPLAGQKGIRLEIEAPAGIHAEADPRRLGEIVLHLVSNAVKFTPSGGRVRVDVAPGIEIRVQDSGVGIAADDQSRIFEKFVRIADPTVPGTGLGLTVARELARMHGGDLTVTSAVGLGSTFIVTIPAAPPEERER
jgi:two-component system, cell cycle sensor histidine kinase PleC